MKAICEGRITRNDVVQQNLEQYRAVFTRTQQQINVLKDVGRAAHPADVEGPLTKRPLGRPYENTLAAPIKADSDCTQARRLGRHRVRCKPWL